jgi:DnaJ-class molecular chaperone
VNGPPGDALVEISVKPHRYFSREGDNLMIEAPITLEEAVLGAKISVPTLSGSVSLSVPKYASSGKVLRLRGKGFPGAKGRGDQLVRLKIIQSDQEEPELEKFFRKYKPKNTFNPRQW